MHVGIAADSSHTASLSVVSKFPGWSSITLHPALKERLHHSGFHSPTDIQANALPHALRGKDIIGVAETVRRFTVREYRLLSLSHTKGSGKTLAYGLPILEHILSAAISHSSYEANTPSVQAHSPRIIKALVLAPTRELALQVCDHLRKMVPPPRSETPDGAEVSGAKPPPLVSIAAIVGGMSSQKQKRILDRGLDILIGTPGRLWDIMQEVR